VDENVPAADDGPILDLAGRRVKAPRLLCALFGAVGPGTRADPDPRWASPASRSRTANGGRFASRLPADAATTGVVAGEIRLTGAKKPIEPQRAS